MLTLSTKKSAVCVTWDVPDVVVPRDVELLGYEVEYEFPSPNESFGTLRDAVKAIVENGVDNCHLSAVGKLVEAGQPDRAVRAVYSRKGEGSWGAWS